MEDSSSNKSVVPVPSGKSVTTTRGSLGLKRKLQKEKFDPVRQLLRSVYPHLDDIEKAKVCMQLIAYLYPKFKPQDVAQTRRPFQNNIQINLPGNGKSEPSVEELLDLAKTEDD